MKRIVFYISDRTGITSETLGHSLLTQFGAIEFTRESLRFIDTPDKAVAAVSKINQAAEAGGSRPIVFSTLIDPTVRDIVAASKGVFFDLFDAFIEPMEQELGMQSSHSIGRSHGMEDIADYESRVNAVNFTLRHDDGATTRDDDRADIILIGVSRSGKTPTCLYLALHYSIFCANYPLTEDDFDELRLPDSLQPFREKLFGLTIKPERLHQIRSQRRPDSRYAALHQCQLEVRHTQALYQKLGIPFLDTTSMSVEEIATSIMQNGQFAKPS